MSVNIDYLADCVLLRHTASTNLGTSKVEILVVFNLLLSITPRCFSSFSFRNQIEALFDELLGGVQES